MWTALRPTCLALLLAVPMAATAQETPTETAPETEEAEPAQTEADPAAGGATPPAENETPTTNDPTTGLDMGRGAGEAAAPGEPQVGQEYIAETSGDWSIRCLKTPEDQPDPCQLYQLLRGSDDNPVAEISIVRLPEGSAAAAGATIVTPLETLLTEDLRISVDGGADRVYEFSFCNQGGCVSRVGFTGAEIAQFRAGNAARMRIVPAAAPDQSIDLTISLTGFTAGFNALAVPEGN
ncbi:invasion associated locus B family protein [Aestuariibius sp. 2305UL40-4]|uniref:invasion associated locus B family protein n=1 Tax=Aestuariibius violaceus TaxID=3234132 RepID=UPI00345EF7A5